MLRTKASTYAILAVTEIAKRQQTRAGGVQAGEIAHCLNLPAAYAAKVLTQLARASLLRSDRGPRGGFRLMRAPAEIPLLDIVEAVDGTMVAGVGLSDAQRETRRASRFVDEVFDRVIAEVRVALNRETVADMLREESAVASMAEAATT